MEASLDVGVEASLFQNPVKLHLTLGTLTLLDEDEVRDAIKVLYDCRKNFIREMLGGELLSVRLRGLEYMNDDPTAVDVLYAQVQLIDEASSNRLQRVVDRIVEEFSQAKILKSDWERDHVKLHVTLMNTKFRRDPSMEIQSSSQIVGRPRESFDASRILQILGGYDFGCIDLREVHLSERYSTALDGYYMNVANISLMP